MHNEISKSVFYTGPNLNPHPVHGIFQPDGIAFVRQNKKGFLLLANEGAYRKEQGVRGSQIAEGNNCLRTVEHYIISSPGINNNIFTTKNICGLMAVFPILQIDAL